MLLRIPQPAAQAVHRHPGEPPLEHVGGHILHKNKPGHEGGAIRHDLPSALPVEVAVPDDGQAVCNRHRVFQPHGAVVSNLSQGLRRRLIPFIKEFGIPPIFFSLGQRGYTHAYQPSFLSDGFIIAKAGRKGNGLLHNSGAVAEEAFVWLHRDGPGSFYYNGSQ